MVISKIREQFVWFKNHQDLIYFDSNATSLKPKSVIKAMQDYYENDTYNPHNDTSIYTSHVGKKIDLIRQATANLLSCNKDEIIFTPGGTYALNQIAFGLKATIKKNDEILLPQYEHASNFLPWLQVAKLTGAKLVVVKQGAKMDIAEPILKAITNKTKVVSFASCSNLFGTAVDPVKLAMRIKTKNQNCLVAVDATQSIQHHQISLKKGYVDFLVFSAHKVFGPTGLGILYVKKTLQQLLTPLIYGGGGYLDYDPLKKSVLLKENHEAFEAGTPNVAAIFGWGAAIDFLNEISYEKISSLEKTLKKYLLTSLKQVDGISLLDVDPVSPTVVFNYRNYSPQDIAYYLSTKKIIVRAGVSCVHLAKKMTTAAQGFVRVSLMFYNTKNEIDRLIEALKEFKVGDSLVGLI